MEDGSKVRVSKRSGCVLPKPPTLTDRKDFKSRSGYIGTVLQLILQLQLSLSSPVCQAQFPRIQPATPSHLHSRVWWSQVPRHLIYFFLDIFFLRILCIRYVSYPLLSNVFTQTLFSLHLFSSTALLYSISAGYTLVLSLFKLYHGTYIILSLASVPGLPCYVLLWGRPWTEATLPSLYPLLCIHNAMQRVPRTPSQQT